MCLASPRDITKTQAPMHVITLGEVRGPEELDATQMTWGAPCGLLASAFSSHRFKVVAVLPCNPHDAPIEMTRDALLGAEPQTCVPLMQRQEQGVLLRCHSCNVSMGCCRPITPLSTGGLEDARRPVPPSPAAPALPFRVKQCGTALCMPTHGTKTAALAWAPCALHIY